MITIKKVSLPVLIFGLCLPSCNFPAKKSQEISKSNADSTIELKYIDTLLIEGNSIWIRKTPVNGKVIFMLDEGSVCYVIEKGEEQTIRGNTDFWYKIEYEEKTGWVFGSQTSIKQITTAESAYGFETFLEHFLTTCFFGQKIDSLLYSSSPLTKHFIHSEIGFSRYYNPGAYCANMGFDSYIRTYNPRQPVITHPAYFKNQHPDDGFCNESSSKDGIYYNVVTDFPKSYDVETDDAVGLGIPYRYKDAPKMVVYVLHNGWIRKTMYFIFADNQWWLVLFDDCDCSA